VILTTGQAFNWELAGTDVSRARWMACCLARSCSRGSDTSRSARGRGALLLCDPGSRISMPTSSHGSSSAGGPCMHGPRSGEALLTWAPSLEPTVDVGTWAQPSRGRSSVQRNLLTSSAGGRSSRRRHYSSRRSNCAAVPLMLFALLGLAPSTGPRVVRLRGFQRMRSCMRSTTCNSARSTCDTVSVVLLLLYFVVVVVGTAVAASRLRAPWIAIIHGWSRS